MVSQACHRIHSHGLLVTAFCAEILDCIFGLLSIPSLMMLQATSSAHYHLVRKHLHRRSRMLAQPFVAIPENLFLILRLSKSAISGSSALRFMLPTNSREWTCKDLDIYTPERKSDIVTNFFLLEGYKISKISKASTVYHPGQFDVTTMTKGGLSIDVVSVHHKNFFTTISRFHLSCLMNFISADGFFSAYPTLTDAEYSIVSHLSFLDHGSTTPMKSTVKSLKKYQLRGFTLLHAPKGIDIHTSNSTAPTHSCGKSVWCPHTPRTTNDPYCLYVPFEATTTSVTFDRPSNRGLYGARCGTIWVLGGPSCDGTYNVLEPFSATREN